MDSDSDDDDKTQTSTLAVEYNDGEKLIRRNKSVTKSGSNKKESNREVSRVDFTKYNSC